MHTLKIEAARLRPGASLVVSRPTGGQTIARVSAVQRFDGAVFATVVFAATEHYFAFWDHDRVTLAVDHPAGTAREDEAEVA